MHCRKFLIPYRDRTSYYPFLAIFLWCAGVVLGLMIPKLAPNDLRPIGGAVVDSQPAIIGSLFLSLFPILLCALWISLDVSWLCFPLVLFRAYSFGYCLSTLFLSFQSAGWLLILLILPCSMLTNVCFLTFLLRHIQEKRKDLLYFTVLCVIFIVLSCLLYHKIAIPFISSLSQYI